MKKRFCLLLLILTVLVGCSSDKYQQQYYSIEELNGKTIATWPGCSFEKYIYNNLENPTIVYGKFVVDIIDLVSTQKADAFVISNLFYRYHQDGLDGVTVFDESVGNVEVAAIFSNTEMGNTVLPQFNEYINKCLKDGTTNKIVEKWMNPKNSPSIDFSKLDPNNPHIKTGYALEEPPYTYKQNNSQCGIDIDLFVGFCNEYGYYPDYFDSDYEAIVPLVQTGRLDLGMAGYNIEESKKASIVYSDIYYYDKVLIGVKSETKKTNVLDNIKNSFYRSFIENNRYMDYIKGAGVTLYITCFVVLLGTLLAFVLYLLKTNEVTIVDRVVDKIDFVLGRIPEIVLLLFLFYVVFVKTSLSAKTVSAICLCIIFTINVYKDLSISISSIDKSQIEAASSLGFGKSEIFFHIVFPQVFELFIAYYEKEIIHILLESSVSGYISTVDLTRAGDIIRNTTYESFLPLIIVAFFYFIVSTIIIKLIDYIRKRGNYKNRSKENILKAINQNTLFKNR